MWRIPEQLERREAYARASPLLCIFMSLVTLRDTENDWVQDSIYNSDTFERYGDRLCKRVQLIVLDTIFSILYIAKQKMKNQEFE